MLLQYLLVYNMLPGGIEPHISNFMSESDDICIIFKVLNRIGY